MTDGGAAIPGVTVLVQKGEPYTYFRKLPIHAAHGATLTDPTLAGVVLRSTRPTVMPGVMYRLFSERAQLERHRQVDGFAGAHEVVVRSVDGRPVPLHVDGDYIGDVTRRPTGWTKPAVRGVLGGMTSSPFDGALRSVEQLAELYDPAAQRAWDKDVGTLDAAARRLIAVSPLVVVSSHDAEGRCDATPRGGPPGFVTVLDDDHLAIPDATGNRRLDTLTNIIATGHVGLLFLIPGREQTLRVNGRARVTRRRRSWSASAPSASRRGRRSSSPPTRSTPTARRPWSAPRSGTRTPGRPRRRPDRRRGHARPPARPAATLADWRSTNVAARAAGLTWSALEGLASGR